MRFIKTHLNSSLKSVVRRIFLAGVIAVTLAFAVLYFRGIGAAWKLTADSTTYVLGAQSIAAGNGYRENGAPAQLFPPGVSILMAGAWLAGQSYRAMNTEVVLFAVASFLVCFLLLRRPLGDLGGMAVVVLCLGSAELYERSTFLLSEYYYVFFSLLALWCYQRGSPAGTVVSSTAAILVRSVGAVLAAAFLLDVIRRKPHNPRRTALFALPLLVSLAWEVRNRRNGWSYSELILEREPWVPASGRTSLGRILSRFRDLPAHARAILDLLTNGLVRHHVWTIVLSALVGGLIALGLWRLFLNPRTSGYLFPAGLYMVVYSVIALLWIPGGTVRLFVPLVPLLFAALIAGVQAVAARTSPAWTYGLAVLLAGFYLANGYRRDSYAMAYYQHTALVGQQVVYPANEDLLRVALWWKEHSDGSSLYACEHPNVLRVITGRPGIDSPSVAVLQDGLHRQHARFLFVDMNSESDQKIDRAARVSAGLRMLREDGQAKLYEVIE